MVYSKEQARRDRRNINPTAEAYIAMSLWSDEYAFKQNGGSMDFWDSLDEQRKQRCRELAQRVRIADIAHGVTAEWRPSMRPSDEPQKAVAEITESGLAVLPPTRC